MRVLNIRSPEAKRLLRAGKAVYIGRGPDSCHMLNTAPPIRGWLGNPVKIGRECPWCGNIHRTGGSTLPCYEELLWRKMRGSIFLPHLIDLHGKDLVCWCKPKPCHGDILVKAIEWAFRNHKES